MTLLLASLDEEQILISSDGLSTLCLKDRLNPKTRNIIRGRTTLQEIFPVPSRTLAIAQCGDNHLLRRSIQSVVEEWFQASVPHTGSQPQGQRGGEGSHGD